MPGNWTHKAHLQSPSHQSGVSVFQYPLCSIFFLLVLKPASCFTKSNSGLLGKKKKRRFSLLTATRLWRTLWKILSTRSPPLSLPLSRSLLAFDHTLDLTRVSKPIHVYHRTHTKESHTLGFWRSTKGYLYWLWKLKQVVSLKTVVEVFLELMTNVHTHANSLISSCVTPPHTHQSPV